MKIHLKEQPLGHSGKDSPFAKLPHSDCGHWFPGQVEVIRQGDGLFTVKSAAYKDDGSPFERQFTPFRNMSEDVTRICLEILKREGYDVGMSIMTAHEQIH